ncbi:MAG: CarD family transcriptional regulator [Clostridiales bacterium]|nr:CarD family transcriptional regulator [Clostridiales bacterium]
MFNVGDKIVYPMYGAGVIEEIEEKEIDGKTCLYYAMMLPVGNLKITISVLKAESLGVRYISPSEEVLDTIRTVGPIEMSSNWNERYKDNSARIKTGELKKVVEVFKTLILKERQRSLSSVEKKMLNNTKQIIVSEIILSQGMEKSEAEKLLYDTTLTKVST